MWTLEDLSNTERQSPEIIIISTVHDYLCGLFASIAYIKRGCVLNRVESSTIHKNKACICPVVFATGAFSHSVANRGNIW